jgi:hypothetical protein
VNPAQRRAFGEELSLARSATRGRRWGEAMAHLERAHVIGQRFVVPHVHSHARMLEVELRRRAPLAAWGQLVRIVLGALGSALGRVPTGNTGGSDVNMFLHMPIPDDLKALVEGREP